MRRWLAALSGIAAAVALAATPADSPAQDKDKNYTTTDESIPTADGVRLRGAFHKSKTGDSTSPVVVLLYPPGVDRDMTKPAGKWAGLIDRLTEAKYHVFQFDWRGHGRSTDITDPIKFWTNPFTGAWNARYVPGYGKKPLVNTIHVKGVRPQYFPAYLTDLAAVRAHLDQKNDQGDLNISSIYLIGSEDTAALGFFWLVAEWNRPGIHPTLPGGLTYDVVPMPGVAVNPEAGKDIAGCVWLTASRSPPNVASMSQRLYQGWAEKTLSLRDNNFMLFLYGEADKAAETQSKFFYNEVLVAGGNKGSIKPVEQTFIRNVPGTKLRGAELLGDNTKLGTEDKIMEYLKFLQKDRQSITRKERKYTVPYYINLSYFGFNP